MLSRVIPLSACTCSHSLVKATLPRLPKLSARTFSHSQVDVPFPMHIGIDETPNAGPGDCHIKGGYVSGEATWTVKLACVSFYKNVAEGLPPGGGIFIVMNAKNGAPLAVIQENRFLTDVRTGAAGAVAVKYLSKPTDTAIGFIGTGAIAKSMARATAAVRPGYVGFAYGHDAAMSKSFCEEMKKARRRGPASPGAAGCSMRSVDVPRRAAGPGFGFRLEAGFGPLHHNSIPTSSCTRLLPTPAAALPNCAGRIRGPAARPDLRPAVRRSSAASSTWSALPRNCAASPRSSSRKRPAPPPCWRRAGSRRAQPSSRRGRTSRPSRRFRWTS